MTTPPGARLPRQRVVAEPPLDAATDARAIIVGDAHGCADEFAQLLAQCAVSARDRVYCVGDLLGKGPDERGVIALCRRYGVRCVVGNWDEKLLATRERVDA